MLFNSIESFNMWRHVTWFRELEDKRDHTLSKHNRKWRRGEGFLVAILLV